MKFLILILTIFLSTQTFAAFTNFSGKWSGHCLSDGEETPSEIIIKNDLNSITFDGEIFSLNTPTVNKVSGKENGQPYQVLMVYDWQWNADKAIITTNEHWLGWYVSQNGAWTGNGTGLIKMNGPQLLTSRIFEIASQGNSRKTEESCTYNLKN